MTPSRKAPTPPPHTSLLLPGRLRDRAWKRFLRGPDPALLDDLYVPALAEAIRYDRCCAYFSSSVLAAAARGYGRLIERLLAMGEDTPRPAVRLVVNEELNAEDVRALTETGDPSGLTALLLKRFKDPTDLLERRRLAMLAWLVQQGLLEVRVGVMRAGPGILHAKFGIITDASGDAVVFAGSGNESAQGLRSNYEMLEVSTSWEDSERHHRYVAEFDALWTDKHDTVHTVSLPEAVRRRLIRLAPPEAPMVEPSNVLARQKAAIRWRFIVEAPYLPNGEAACDATALVDLWPHQHRVVAESADAWPDGRLLCDEVGLGKTIEATLILRRLLAGRGVRRALLLVPAGLARQWQEELREKGGLLIPRYELAGKLVWPDGREQKVAGLADALGQDLLLLSRETARTEENRQRLLTAEPWDLVLLDEAHAARRKEQEEGEFNSGTLLLTLLRELQLRRRARGFLFLSATPMQTDPWEPWDLLTVLGEGGAWMAEFDAVRVFYAAIAAVRDGGCDLETARRAATLVAADPGFPPLPDTRTPPSDAYALARALAFVVPSRREALAHWLREGSPLSRRMHRNTRRTLRHYFEMGQLAQLPPRRAVEDIFFEYQDVAERAVYDAVGDYIERRFALLDDERSGKGFVKTVYSRRAASSPYALEQSLLRRRDGLARIAEGHAHETELSRQDQPDALDPSDLPEGDGQIKESAALPQDPKVAREELAEVDTLIGDLRALAGRDTKRDRFFEVLRHVADQGRPVLVFTEYVDTLEYLRDLLAPHYGDALGCYTGGGGQLRNGSAWAPVSKTTITETLEAGRLRILLCTDAASEGLNLQAAGAVINYDLPWNPSKVEQRIGRIDRIGQTLPVVRVVNLFLRDSVDDQVYRALRRRCGLFEHFVGAMQRVLSRARRMLLGHEPLDLGAIDATAREVEADALAEGTYLESPAHLFPEDPAPVTREDLLRAIGSLKGEVGFRATRVRGRNTHTITGPGFRKVIVSHDPVTLDREPSVAPLSPFDPRLREIVDRLTRPGERLPLVVGTAQTGAFRRSVAYWVLGERPEPVQTMQDLERHLGVWDGTCPDSARWQEAEEAARTAAEAQVKALAERAAQRERYALERQVAAARRRLLVELGRYLACFGEGAADLNGVLHRQMGRDIASAQRLRQCLDRLGGYPEWPEPLRHELAVFVQGLTDNRKKARLLGRELDAALQDPRWRAGG
ncbi:MAG: helicase-related protein [bacterium]|nr:helicase-related protein [bacterium]